MSRGTTMLALQLRDAGWLELVELSMPAPATDELLIRTAATTICTSDLNDMRYNPFGIELPRVLGHEGAGVVAAVGRDITGFRAGDRIAAHPVIPCGRCDSCLRGLAHLCDNMSHLGLDRDGTFAEYFTIPAGRARRIPEGVDSATAALLEPVCVCIEALERAAISPGDAVLVVGDGPFGVIISRLASQYRPGVVIFVGRHDFRLEQVPEAVRINEKRTPDALAAVLAATDGRGVDAAILGAGNKDAMDLCLRSLRARGRISLFSAIADPVPVDLFRVHVKELEIRGSCNDQDHIDRAVELLSDRDLGLERVVTHRLAFEDWRRAFELASAGKDEALKVAITFGSAED